MTIIEELRHAVNGATTPCSLVEIGLGPAEEVALVRLSKTAGRRHLQNDPQGCALAFLAAATVAAREHAGEHELWPHVRRWFEGSPGTELFDPNAQPATELKSAVEDMVRRLGLRHGFDRERGEHRCYLTVLLQCGFTKKGLDRLPDWLAGANKWRAVEVLLEDPELRSDTFRETFEQLRAVRLGWYEDVPATPWLRGDLHECARRAARKDLSLGTEPASGAASGDRTRLVERGGNALAFRVPVSVPLYIAAQRVPHVDLEIAGHRGPRALLQPDGTYPPLPDTFVDCPDVSPSGLVHVVLTGHDGTLLEDEQVDVFSGSEDIDLFLRAGKNEYRRAADPWTEPTPNYAAIVRVSADLPLDGRFAAARLRLRGSIWQRVEPDEMPTVRVSFGNDIAWTFERRRVWPGRAEVLVPLDAWEASKEVVWTVRLDSDRARIKSARLGRHNLLVERASDHTRLILPRTRHLPFSHTARLTIEEGSERFVLSVRAPPPESRSFLTRSENGWKEVFISDLASLSRPVRWMARPNSDGDVAWLFEGDRPVLPLQDREVVIAQRLSCIGAPLQVEPRRFNPQSPPVVLTKSLTANGPLGPLDESPPYMTVRIRSLSWRPEYNLQTLCKDGSVRTLTHAEFDVDGNLIMFEAPAVAMAVVCGDTALATAVSDHLSSAIEAAQSVLGCIGWLIRNRVALAVPELHPAVLRALQRQPLDTIALGYELDSRVGDPARVEALAGLWRYWMEQSIDGAELALAQGVAGQAGVTTLLEDKNPYSHPSVPGNAVTAALRQLAFFDPVSGIRVLRAALRASDPSLKQTLRSARGELLGLWADTPSMSDMARVLTVDSGFLAAHNRAAVDCALGERLPSNYLRNLRRLFYLPEFRKAVAREAVRRTLAG